MLTIRLMRFGRKHQPFFRIVVIPKRGKPARSKYIEMLGWVNPMKHEHHVVADRVRYWLSVGAQPSATAWNLFVREGIAEGPKRPKGLRPKAAAVAAEGDSEAAAEAEARGEASSLDAPPAESEESGAGGDSRTAEREVQATTAETADS